MQLHITEKDRLTKSSSSAYEGLASPRLAEYMLNNNTKVKVEEIKTEQDQVEDNFTRMNSEIHKLFRPINF